jgi:hypothetical protein
MERDDDERRDTELRLLISSAMVAAESASWNSRSLEQTTAFNSNRAADCCAPLGE